MKNTWSRLENIFNISSGRGERYSQREGNQFDVVHASPSSSGEML